MKMSKSWFMPVFLVIALAISLTLASVAMPQRSVEGHKLSLTLNGWHPPDAAVYPSGATTKHSAMLPKALVAPHGGPGVGHSPARLWIYANQIVTGTASVLSGAPERRNWRMRWE